MQVIIVRHGKAERQSASGRDGDRVLASRGHEQAKYLAGALGKEAPRAGLILSSSLCRAIQTARAVLEGLAEDAVLQVERALEPGHGVEEVVRVIGRERDGGRAALVLVGHNPQLEELVWTLVGGPEGHIQMRTGEAAALRAPEQAGSALQGACRVERMLRLDVGEGD